MSIIATLDAAYDVSKARASTLGASPQTIEQAATARAALFSAMRTEFSSELTDLISRAVQAAKE
jgi:hypothetical protein